MLKFVLIKSVLKFSDDYPYKYFIFGPGSV